MAIKIGKGPKATGASFFGPGYEAPVGREAPELSDPEKDPHAATKKELTEWLKKHRPQQWEGILKGTVPKSKKIISHARQRIRNRKYRKSLPPGREISFQQSDAAWQVVYGTCRVPALYTFAHVLSNSKSNLHLILTLAAHRISQVATLYLDDIAMELGVDRWADGPTNSDGRNFADKVFMSVSTGAAGQSANPDAVGQLNVAPDYFWTSSHVLDNRAHAYLLLVYQKETFPEGLPDIDFLVDGALVYDPRTTSTAFSRNAALCIADYLTNTTYGLGYDWSQIDTTSLGDAADCCDEVVTLKDSGTEPRYCLDGYFTTEETPQSILEDMVSAMAGDIVFSNGLWRFLPGEYRTPSSVVLTTDDLRTPPTIETKISANDNYNSVRGTFVSAENTYETTDYPAVSVTAYVTADNGVTTWEDISLPFTTSASRAQRIARIALERVRRQITLTAEWSLKAYQFNIGDNVKVTIDRYGWTEKVFAVADYELAFSDGGALTVQLTLREIDSGVFSWTPATDEQTIHVAPTTTLPKPGSVTNPSALTVESGTDYLDVRLDGTVFSRAYLYWDAPDDPFVTDGGSIEIQYKKTSASSYTPAQVVPGDQTHAYILNVADGVSYTFRIRSRNSLNIAASTWVSYVHTVVGKSAPPSNVPSITAVAEDYGIEISWEEVPDLDLKWYYLKYGGGSFGGATKLTLTKATSFIWKRKAAGTYTFRIKAIDTSGNESVAETTCELEIEAPSAPTVSITIEGEDVRLSWTAPTSGSHAIREYEIRYGDSWGDSEFVGRVSALVYKRKVDWSGERNFLVAAIDVGGNTGSAGTNSATVTTPTAVTSLTILQIDNNVLIDWTDPTTHTLPISYYNVKRGTPAQSFADATLVGKVNATFCKVMEQLGAQYKYWVQPVDSAGNVGTESALTLIVYDPPDYILAADQAVDADAGTTTNLLAGVTDYLAEASLVGPVDDDETWTTHYTESSFDTVQDFIDAGYSTWYEPVPTSGDFDYTIDLGVVVPNSTITLSYNESTIGGSVTVTPTLSYKTLSGDSWTAGTAGELQVWATNFQYIRVQLAFAGSTDKSITAVDLLRVVVSVKKQTDSGTSTSLASGGKQVDYNLSFLDVTHISVTPKVSSDSEKYQVVVNRNDTPGSQYFEVWIFKADGTQVAKNFSWSAEGLVNVIS